MSPLSIRTSRSLQIENEDNVIVVSNVKIWFRGLPPSLTHHDKLAFEGSTSISLSNTIHLSSEGKYGSNFSLTVSIVAFGEDYLVCDFKTALFDGASLKLDDAEGQFRTSILDSFSEPTFIENYVRLLYLSSPTFKYITDVSLIPLTSEPTLFPTASLSDIRFDGIMLEFYGIRELNQFQMYLLKTSTEGFLLDSLSSEITSELGNSIFKEVFLEFFSTRNFYFNKLEVLMKVSISVRSGSSIPLSTDTIKYKTISILKNRQKDYLATLAVLRHNIYAFQITALTSAPSAIPSTSNPSVEPTPHPSFSPSIPPTALPTFFPSTTPSVDPNLQDIQFGGIFLEFFGINELNQFQTYLLKISTERFLIDEFTAELKNTTFKKINLEFSSVDDYFSNKLRLMMEVSVSVLPNLTTSLGGDALKYVAETIFNHKQIEYLAALTVLRQNIKTYQVVVMTSAPRAVPSLHPSFLPTLSPNFPSGAPTYKPTLSPSTLPSSLPTDLRSSLPSVNPFETPSGNPQHVPNMVPSKMPSNFPSTIPSSIPSTSPTIGPSFQPSFIPSSSPAKYPSALPITFPSNLPSFMPRSRPSRYPSSISSYAPFGVPSSVPSNVPSTVPSIYPSMSFKPSLTPSFFPSDSLLPSKSPTKAPSENPTMMPTPCEDDTTYKSRFGFGCHIHSLSVCSKMNKVGFTVEEINELLERCKKSCDMCWLSQIPSEIPSNVPNSPKTSPPSLSLTISPSIISSSFPTIKTSLRITSMPTEEVSFNPSFQLSLFSLKPAAQLQAKSLYMFPEYPSLVPTKLESKPSFISASKPVFQQESNPMSEEVTKLTLSQNLNQTFNPSVLDGSPSHPLDVALGTEASLDDTYNFGTVDSKYSCTDDPTFQNRYGLTCQQHNDIVCENLMQIGFSEEEVEEIIDKCKSSCKRCPASDTHHSDDIITRGTDSYVDVPKVVNNNFIIMSLVIGAALLVLLVFGLITMQKRKKVKVKHGKKVELPQEPIDTFFKELQNEVCSNDMGNSVNNLRNHSMDTSDNKIDLNNIAAATAETIKEITSYADSMLDVDNEIVLGGALLDATKQVHWNEPSIKETQYFEIESSEMESIMSSITDLSRKSSFESIEGVARCMPC